jgi:hypothetical protein
MFTTVQIVLNDAHIRWIHTSLVTHGYDVPRSKTVDSCARRFSYSEQLHVRIAFRMESAAVRLRLVYVLSTSCLARVPIWAGLENKNICACSPQPPRTIIFYETNPYVYDASDLNRERKCLLYIGTKYAYNFGRSAKGTLCRIEPVSLG